MKKEKAFPRRQKERTFSLHSTATNYANDETEEKEEHLQIFSPAKIRRQRILTYGLKKTNLKICKNLDDVSQHFGLNDEKHI
jgi:hypothetical protein